MDQHGNTVAQEGMDRCFCGCKYWENDKCVDCGTPVRRSSQMTKTEVKQTVAELRKNAQRISNLLDSQPSRAVGDDYKQARIEESLNNIDGLTAMLREGLLDEEG